MKKKPKVIIVSVLLICCLIVAFTSLPWFRVQYHLHALRQAWSLLAAEQSSQTMTESTRIQRVQDYERQMQALLRLEYLQQSEMSLQHCVLTGAVRNAFASFVSHSFPTNEFYDYYCPSNGTRLVVICPKTETDKWQKLVADYDKP
jgi:hypothetical protein